jgi:hypothetical protein
VAIRDGSDDFIGKPGVSGSWMAAFTGLQTIATRCVATIGLTPKRGGKNS